MQFLFLFCVILLKIQWWKTASKSEKGERESMPLQQLKCFKTNKGTVSTRPH